jgi:hypothetical protein
MQLGYWSPVRKPEKENCSPALQKGNITNNRFSVIFQVEEAEKLNINPIIY